MSRIATAQLYQMNQDHVGQAREKEVSTAEKASTFKQINRPSDAPTDWVVNSNHKDDLNMREGIEKNASMATHMLTVSDNVLSQLTEYAQRARELAIANSSTAFADRKLSVGEAQSLYENVIRALNTNYGGKTLWGGFKTKSPAFDMSGQYLGDRGSFEIEIGKGLIVPVNLSAPELIQGEGLTSGVNIPAVFQRFVQGLKNNDTEMIRGTLDDFMKTIDQISLGRTKVGARQSEIERAVDSNQVQRIETLENISKIEEADPAKVFSDLSRDQTVLKAAISTSSKILSEDPLGIFFK
jgi:flagellar hook-associated protein 3 FlgL